MLEAILFSLAALVAGQTEIQFLDPARNEEGRIYPVSGETVSIRIDHEGKPAEGALLVAVYRPKSSVEKEVEVGRSREDGTIEWIPETSGLVQLTATVERRVEEDEVQKVTSTETISVRFRGIPWAGVAVFLIAGVFLFGGVVLAFKKLTSPD